MKNYVRLIALAFIHFAVQVFTLKAQQLAFNPVTSKEGILTGNINGIAQDAQGYMWFTATGLYRYDGYQFTSYKNDPSNAQSLTSDRLESICIDHNGIIWVGTFDSGLDRLDPASDVFTHFRNKPDDSTSLSNNTCTVIVEDHEGVIWVGTHGGLNRLDQQSGKFTRYQHKPNDPTSLSNNQVRALYEDRQGVLWVGTGSPFPADSTPPGQGGLNKLDKGRGTFTRYMHDPKNPHSLIDNKVRAICEDSRGNFWIGTYGDGLHTMDRAKGTFTRYHYDPAHPEKLSRPYLKRRRTADGITFIHEDATGIIWIGSYEGGLNLYNPATRLVTHYEGRQQPDSLFNDGTWAIYSSRDGVVWMSTTGDNQYRINPFQKHIPHHTLPEGQVNALLYEPGNMLWIGSTKGLLRYDRNNKSIRRFLNNPNDPSSLSHNVINSITKDKDGNIWIGTNKGLNKFNRNKGTFTRYDINSKNTSFISDYIINVYSDAESNLWMASTGSVDRMDLKTGKFTNYLRDAADTSDFGNNGAISIFQDNRKKLWVCGNIVRQLDQKTGKLKDYLNVKWPLKFYQDMDSVVWVGSGEGLYRYYPAYDSFYLFEDSRFSKELKNVWNILEDDHKNLWVSSINGIMRINARRNQTSLYGVKYGIPGFTDINLFSGFKGQNGEFFFGNSTGYYYFFPDDFPRSLQPPQIVINTFRLGDQIVKPAENGPLFQPLAVVKEIRLKYNQNVFSFDFAGIDYSNPEDNILYFMLQGYNDTWHQAGAERTAYYFNVPPGNYVFRVKTANNDGLWAEISIKITITPPWWRTWWAYCIYGLLFITGIYAIHRIQRQRVISTERERARVRELAQAKEIEKAYKQLEVKSA
ncbi:MAG: two-component regulator propeller domain-containing protein, partial [Ginsengibacter sp.]